MLRFINSSQQQSGSGFSDIFPVVKQVDNISTISQDHLTSTSSPATHLNVLRYHQHLPGYLTHYITDYTDTPVLSNVSAS